MPRSREQERIHKQKQRANRRAERDADPRDVDGLLKAHANHLIPPVRALHTDMESIEVDGYEAIPIGTLLGGVTDFKILRGSTVSLNITTSVEYRHLATDAAVMSKGNLLVMRLYQIPRSAVFPDPDDEEGDDDES